MNGHFYICFFFIVFILLFPLAFSTSMNTLSPTETLTMSSNRTIVSPSNVFELGFFKPSSLSRWYLGIWYKKVPQRTYVWVANRDKPLTKSIGTLKISNTNLLLLDHSNQIIWSTNLTKTHVKSSHLVAELLDNGNFVLKDSNNKDPADPFLWQSFDFPTDTLLPEMKIGRNLKKGLDIFLTSWKSPNDPSSGDYFFKLKTKPFPEFYIWKNDFQMFRIGPWDGILYRGMPSYLVSYFTRTKQEIVYEFVVPNHNIYSNMKISSSGSLQRVMWKSNSFKWNLLWSFPVEECDAYQICGSYSYCEMKTSATCNCIKGFKPVDWKEWVLKDWWKGCVTKTPLSCGGDKFVRLRNMKLPVSDTATVVDRKIGIKECEKRCVGNCKCTAFANSDIENGGLGCVIWTGELMDLRNYVEGGKDLYVRSAS